MAFIECRDLHFSYSGESGEVLHGVDLDIEKGSFVALLGHNGCGKSTMAKLFNGMLVPTSGTVTVDGRDVSSANEAQLVEYRRADVGFVFQFYNLVPNLTALENVELAAQICPDSLDAEQTLCQVGLGERLANFPAQLSGGEQQRVSIARALAKNPKLLLCDEPTGALDSRNAAVLLETLEVLNAKLHATIMMVTHDAVAASYADRILFIKDGKLFNELRRGDDDRTGFYQRILEVQAFLSGKQGDSPAVGFVASHVTALRN